MDLGLAGRTAAVAAASDGLGFAAARALADEGARVAICGRDLARITAAAERIGSGCVGFVQDVATVDGARAFVDRAIAELGHVDVLVANGGGPRPGTFASTTVEEFPPALEANLLAVVEMCRRAVPPMRQRRWGRVVAITSVGVRQPLANLILSNTARSATTAFLKTVAREVAADGVTVNSVQPGIHDTARIKSLYGDNNEAVLAGIPAGTLGDPADFGAVTAFLCSEQARFVTGVHLQVDGGSYSGLL